MEHFEIKIWGNPNGFKELTITESALLTDEDIRRRGLDSVDILCNEYYSLFYTNNCYVISLHFMLPSSIKSKVGFRDNSTIISVILERGFKLNNAIEVLQSMKDGYLTFVSELPHIDELGKRLSNKMSDFESIVYSGLFQDLEQFMININNNSTQSGVVLYKDLNDLVHYLDVPCRKEYIGYFVVYLAPSAESKKFLNYKSIVVSPQYKLSYDVLFPEYKGDIPIISIHSLDDKIEIICKKEYYHDILLEGTLRDNLTSWQVRRSADKTQYIIGLKFIPMISTYKIVCYDKQHKPLDRDLKWLKSNYGEIDNSQNCISFHAKISYSELKFESTDPKTEFKFKFNKELQCFEFEVVSYNVYDVSALREYIKNKYNFIPSIQIKEKKKTRTSGDDVSNEKFFKYEGAELDFDILIQASEVYEEYLFPMNTNVADIKLNEKKRNKISFVVEGRFAKKEFRRRDSKIIFIDKENNNKLSITREEPFICIVNRKLKYHYTVKFKGFCSKNDLEIDSKQNEYSLCFKPKLVTRIRYVRSYIFCLIIGLVFGVAVTIGTQCLLQQNSKGEVVNNNAGNNAGNNTGNNTGNNAGNNTGNNAGNSSPVQYTKRQQDSITLQSKLDSLNGISYTRADIKEISELAKKMGLYQSLAKPKIDIALKCLNHLCVNQKSSAEVLKQFLNDNDTILSNEQKEVIQIIIGNVELQDAYESDRGQYKSIKQLKDSINQKLGM